MKLNAKVIETISGQQYDDKQPRVKLKVVEADSCFRTFVVPNADGYALDDELVVLVLRQDEAASLRETLLRSQPLPHKPQEFRDTLLDQLRPDTAETQEFVREGSL